MTVRIRNLWDESPTEKGPTMFSTELEVGAVREHVPMIRTMASDRKWVLVDAYLPHDPDTDHSDPRVRSVEFLLRIEQQPKVGDRITVAITGSLVAEGGAADG